MVPEWALLGVSDDVVMVVAHRLRKSEEEPMRKQ